MENIILSLPVLIPVMMAFFVFLTPRTNRWLKEIITILAVTANLGTCVFFFGKEMVFSVPWISLGTLKIDFILRLYQFSAFILLAVAGFSFLIAIYSAVSMKGREHLRQYYAFLLLTVAMVNGAVLANNLVLMLFFWEGLLITLFAMIMSGGKTAFPTAVKAFVLVGISDFCMILGIILVGFMTSGELTMDVIQKSPIATTSLMGGAAFVLIMIGAISKAGSLPFHSWIPDAAIDAPLPFMAFLPAALEKLLGIYFLARITLDLFAIKSGSAMSVTMMTVGSITIIIAVMMALIQKDYKRLLSYHAISQVGYMILGIGTAIPVGIVGGLFHMINHAMYKSCLFLTGGSVEKQAGTTNLKELGGLGRKMPITFTCFIIAAAAISGVPPFNGFFSKELIFDGALESGYTVFYVLAVAGAFFTAASFLKLGHAAFLGKPGKNIERVKDPSWAMLLPMIIIAGGCVLFGVYNPLPLNNLIQPILGARLEHSYAGLPASWTLVAVSLVVLSLALINHLLGAKKAGSGIGAVDHIHHAPGLSKVYDLAERRYFDPYNISMIFINIAAKILFWIDRGIDWIYNRFIVSITNFASRMIRTAHTGNYSLYVLWSIAGMAAIAVVFVMQLR
jgi:NADH:ubiquinone oxidoreductase subunit 5 (subunit L)/multisubunit Na+/H+ antiporter MnhA subunit